MEELFVRYAHYIGFIALASTLVTQNVLISEKLTASQMRKMVTIDGIYGFSSVMTLIAGLLLVFWVGKPSQYYAGNMIFHLKAGIFIVIAVMSIYPTVFFMRSRNTIGADVEVPRIILTIKRAELLVLSVLPLLAILMARGYGSS